MAEKNKTDYRMCVTIDKSDAESLKAVAKNRGYKTVAPLIRIAIKEHLRGLEATGIINNNNS